MFSSPTLSRSNQQQSPMNRVVSKRVIDEKSKTIEQLKTIIDELQVRHERKERELMKRIGLLYHDLQQSKKKMAHLIYKQQQHQQKQCDNESKIYREISTQTDQYHSSSLCPNCSTHLSDRSQCQDENLMEFLHKLKLNEEEIYSEQPKYYTLQPEDDVEYISATPAVTFNQSLSSPSLSTTDRSSSSTSSTKHNESSSSAYNTAESLPSSTYSDEIESLERVLNAACTMYTTHDNLEHTIKLQEELFRQRLRLRGIAVEHPNDRHDSSSSEHLYDNIDGEASEVDKSETNKRNRCLPIHQKVSKTNVSLSTDDDEQQQQQRYKLKLSKSQKVRFVDPNHSMGKRKSFKSSSKTNLNKLNKEKRSNSNQTSTVSKKFPLPISSNMLTVTIT